MTDRTTRELQQLNLYTGADLPDIAHNQELLSFAEYAYATTNMQLQTRSEGEKNRELFQAPLQSEQAAGSCSLGGRGRQGNSEPYQAPGLRPRLRHIGPCGIENHRLAVVLQN